MNELKSVYMKCGHTTTATLAPDNIPFCPICLCRELTEEPNLEGREAHCVLCLHKRPSSFNLPFFQYCEGNEHDFFYDGCEGWN